MNKFKFEFEDEISEDEVKDILRNLNNIFSIPEGTLPLIRGLGLSNSNVSKIPVDLENDIVTDTVAKVAEYEPRVSVSNVEFAHSQDGESEIKVFLEGGEISGI